MINRNRLLALFAELTAIDSPSRGERQMADRLKQKLAALGAAAHEDDAAQKIGGSAGNLYAYIDGTLPQPPLLLSAHMDTVEPSCGKKAVFHADGRITSDGSTVLGADDVSGVCVILEALTALQESGAAHRPLEVLFDVAEETYCTGIQAFDFSRLRAKEGYVFDLSGPVGCAANRAPAIVSFRAKFCGRSAHAAFSPEKGIHAVKAAAAAIAAIPCGHVDDTTVNVGTIQGGIADNVVPDQCVVTGEVRSFSNESEQARLEQIARTMQSAAEAFGAAVEFSTTPLCRAYCVPPEDPVCAHFRTACAQTGLSGQLVDTYGGSDNNHFFFHGVRALVVASGMNNCHSCAEYTTADELVRAAELTLALITHRTL